MRNKRRIDLVNCDFNFQNKNNPNTNEIKVIAPNSFGAVQLQENLRTVKQANGITLIALVVTIVVLLILAGISISTVLGNNGIIPRANEAKFKTDLANIQEEFNLYVMDKTGENGDFSVGSLNASSNLLTYNTQPDEEKGTGSISSVLKSATAQKYIQSKSFSIIKGDLIYASQNAKELEWAQQVGLAINPYNIDENGVLLSSDTNLMLMDEVTGTVVIPEMVTAIGEGTFANVKGLKRIVIPPTVNEIKANAFSGNNEIEEVIIQANEEKGLGVKKICESAFYGCSRLNSIIIPNTVTSIDAYALANCSSLVNVTLSKNVKLDGPVLQSCSKLETITIPEGITEISGWGTFFNCGALKKIIIPSTLTTLDVSSFCRCPAIEDITFSGNGSNFIFEDGILLSKDRSSMYIVTAKAIGNSKEFRVPEGIKEIPGQMLPMYKLTKVYIPASLEKLEGRSFPASIEEIEVAPENNRIMNSNGNIISKDERKILYVCLNKSEIINIDEGIKEISTAAFVPCTNAKVINLPDSLERLVDESIFAECVASTVNIGKGFKTYNPRVFINLNGIKKVEISSENPNFSSDGVAIYNKNKTILIKLVKVDIKEYVIPTTVTQIADRAMNALHSLVNIEIPNTVQVIGNHAFYNCYNLVELNIPESVNTIGIGAFYGCNKLNKIQINKKKGDISGSPWLVPIGERAIKWLKE